MNNVQPPCEIKMEPKMSPSDVDLNFKPQMRGRSNTWPLRPREVGPSDGPDSQNSPSHEEGVGPPVMGEAGLQGKDALAINKKTSSRRNAWGNLSYADLITKAIQSSPDQRLTLSQIYDWMVQNVPYFKDKGDSTSSAGWKNSIRHNLSLHNRFMRVPNEGSGKSSWWVINPDAKPGKSPRRRAGSMETKVYEKKKNRAKKKAEQLRALEQGGNSPTASSDGDLLNESPVPGFQLSPEFDFRPRASSNASSCGRLSPIQAVVEPDLHDNQVPPMSPIPWNPEMETEVGSIDSFTDQLVDSLPGSMSLSDKSLQQHILQSSSVHRYSTGTPGAQPTSAYNQYSDYTAPPPPPPPPYPEHMRTSPQTQSGHSKAAQSQTGQQNQLTTMDALSMSNHDGYGAVTLGSLQNGLELYANSDSLLKSMVGSDPQGQMTSGIPDAGQIVQQSIQQQHQHQQQQQQQQQQKQLQQSQPRPPMQLQDPSQAQLHSIATSRSGPGGHPCAVAVGSGHDKKPIGLSSVVTGSVVAQQGNQILAGYSQQMSKVQQPPSSQTQQQTQQQQQQHHQVHRSQPQPTTTQSKLAQSGLLPQLMQSVPNNSILRAALMHNSQPLRNQGNSANILPYNQFNRDIYNNAITSYGDTMAGLVNNIHTSSTSISDCRMVTAAGANLRGTNCLNGSIRGNLQPMGPQLAGLQTRHLHGQSGGMDMMCQQEAGNPSCQQSNFPCDIDFEMLWNSTNLECDVAAVIQHELSMNENLDFNFDPLPG